MKLSRSYLGKEVRLVWRDPVSNPLRMPVRRAFVGKGALARWTEWGKIDDLTDGVVRICHSYGEDPPEDGNPEPEGFWTWVAEELVESVTILAAEPALAPDPGAKA